MFVLSFSLNSHSQVVQQTLYVSEVDQALAFESIAVAPVIDNVSDIYSAALTQALLDTLNNEKQYRAIPLTQKMDTDVFENTKALEILNSSSSDALLSSRIQRGPQGIQMRMSLASRPDGNILIQESKTIDKRESINDIRAEFIELFKTAVARLPFDGKILSRRGADVTLDVGSLKGVRSGQEVEVVQLIKVNRHPKHQFMVGSKKTVLGKIRLTQVDPTLSFGQITFEKERGVVLVGSKVMSDRKVIYPSATSLPQNPQFGDSPKEWVPQGPATFGRIALLAGLGQYNQSADLVTQGNVDATSNISPTLKFEGELWLNPEWFLSLGLMQSAFTLSNPISADSPSSLDTSLSSYTLSAGYNWLLEGDFYGPKIQVAGGLHQWTSDPDRSSPTVAFTRMQFGGLFVSVDASFVLDPASSWSLGANFKYYLSKSATDSPSSGSAGSEDITDFGFYARSKKTERMSYIGRLNFESYSSSFSGTASRPDPATKISHKNQILLLGIEYGF